MAQRIDGCGATCPRVCPEITHPRYSGRRGASAQAFGATASAGNRTLRPMRHIDMSTRRLAGRHRTRDLVRPIAIASVALIATVAGACTSSASPGSAAPSAPPIATSPAPPTAITPGPSHRGSACPAQLVVTPADISRTLCVAKGGTVTITAQPEQAQGWTPFHVSGAALATAASTPAPTGTAKVLAAFSAVAAGISTVASAHRNCPSNSTGVACHSIVLWQVTVVVK